MGIYVVTPPTSNHDSRASSSYLVHPFKQCIYIHTIDSQSQQLSLILIPSNHAYTNYTNGPRLRQGSPILVPTQFHQAVTRD